MTFPFYKQPRSKVSGPTCLRIIAKHYGTLITLKEIREILETNREGNSLLKINILIFLGMLLIGCKNPESIGLLTVEVPKKTDQGIELNEISDSVIKITLENHEEALITNVKEVVRIDSYFVVITIDHRIFIFEQSGKFFKALGRQGDGPGEYKFVNAIGVDEDLRKFYIVSLRKVLVYTFEFNLVDEFTLDFFISNLSFEKDKIHVISYEYEIVVDGGFATETSLYILNNNFKTLDTIPLRKVVRKDRQASLLGYDKFISTNGFNSFIYAPVATNEHFLRDTVFQLDTDSIIPYAKLGFAEPHLDERRIKRYVIANIFLTANYLGSHYYKDGNDIYFFLYNRKTSKAYNFKGGPLDDEGDTVVLNLLDASSDTFYYVKTIGFTNASKEEQNPVIGIVRLK
jgi:hypothetical protein